MVKKPVKKGTKPKRKTVRRRSNKSTIVAKLDPRRFPGMSPKMAAIVGYIVDKKYTDPEIEGMVVTSDGYVLARQTGDIGHNTIIGDYDSLCNNWANLIDAAGLTTDEYIAAADLFRKKLLGR